MNRKVTEITFILVILIISIGIGLVLYRQNSSSAIEVTNMQLSYGPQTYYGYPTGNYIPFIGFTVENTHSSTLTTVGIAVDGVNYSYSTLTLPPGQIQSESLPLQNMNLASSTNYSIRLTFTFADGKYESYSQSYTSPKFQGQVQITSLAWTKVGDFWTAFSLTLQNTGNLPITKIICTVTNQGWGIVFSIYGAVMPGNSISGSTSILQESVQAGYYYPMTIQLTCVDGSTSTIQTSAMAPS